MEISQVLTLWLLRAGRIDAFKRIENLTGINQKQLISNCDKSPRHMIVNYLFR